MSKPWFLQIRFLVLNSKKHKVRDGKEASGWNYRLLT